MSINNSGSLFLQATYFIHKNVIFLDQLNPLV